MAYLTLLFCILFHTQSSNVISSDTIYVNSTIIESTLYQGGAQISRSATVNLNKGLNTIVLQGLTNYLQNSSINIKADMPFQIVSLTVGQNYLGEQESRPEVARLKVRLDSLIEKRTLLTTELEIIQSKVEFVNGLRQLSAESKYSASELKAMLDLYGTELMSLETDRLRNNKRNKILDEQIRRIQDQINELNGNKGLASKQITAVIRSERSGTTDLWINYLSSGVFWKPNYQIRSLPEQDLVTFSTSAEITQLTGNNWTNVRLALNSGQPFKNDRMPEIRPQQASLLNVEAKAEASFDVMVRGRGSINAMTEEVPSLAENEYSSNQTSFSYTLGDIASIPSGVRDYQIEIRRDTVSADFRYRTLPAYKKDAYLTAQIADWERLNLLRGTARIYSADTYLGQQTIDSRELTDSLSLSFGQDERISVDRKQLVDYTEKRFFGNKIRETKSYEISLRNTRDQAITIEVLDQIPISTNESISIKATELSGGSLNEETGIITWDLQLDPGETRALRFSFEVEYPKGEQVVY